MAQQRAYFFVVTSDKSRFLTGDEPTEQTFRELIASVAFRTEQGDQATSQQRGLVRFATPEEVEDFLDGGINGDMLTVGPDQLPIVQAGDATVTVQAVFSGKKWVFKVTANASALGIPAAGSWEQIGDATTGNVDNQFDPGYGDAGSILRVRTLPNNLAQLSGYFEKTTSANNARMMKLAAAYRPLSTQFGIAFWDMVTTDDYGSASILIGTDGVVMVSTGYSFATGNSYTPLLLLNTRFTVNFIYPLN